MESRDLGARYGRVLLCFLGGGTLVARNTFFALKTTTRASVASYTLMLAPTALPPGAAEIEITTTQLLIWPRRYAVSSPTPLCYARQQGGGGWLP
jgi:hypothetical protein